MLPEPHEPADRATGHADRDLQQRVRHRLRRVPGGQGRRAGERRPWRPPWTGRLRHRVLRQVPQRVRRRCTTAPLLPAGTRGVPSPPSRAASTATSDSPTRCRSASPRRPRPGVREEVLHDVPRAGGRRRTSGSRRTGPAAVHGLRALRAALALHRPAQVPRDQQGARELPQPFRDGVRTSRTSPPTCKQQPLSATVEGAAPGINLAQQMDTLRSVDDQVRAHVRRGRSASGRLDRTLFVYVSDNGYMHGEHRLDGKGYPYLKSTNVPLVMRWGAGSTGTVDDRLTIANVDIHATILQAAGLANTSAGSFDAARPQRRKACPLVGAESTSRVVRPPFCAWRTRDELFVRYGSAEEEFYDYRADPYELDNRIERPGLRRAASTKLRATGTGRLRPAATGLRADVRPAPVASGARWHCTAAAGSGQRQGDAGVAPGRRLAPAATSRRETPEHAAGAPRPDAPASVIRPWRPRGARAGPRARRAEPAARCRRTARSTPR